MTAAASRWRTWAEANYPDARYIDGMVTDSDPRCYAVVVTCGPRGSVTLHRERRTAVIEIGLLDPWYDGGPLAGMGCGRFCQGEHRIVDVAALLAGEPGAVAARPVPAAPASGLKPAPAPAAVRRHDRHGNQTPEWAAWRTLQASGAPTAFSDFETFVAAVGPAPGRGYQLDGGRWVKVKKDRSKPIMLTHAGRTQSVAEWAKELGVSPAKLRGRLRIGWSVAKTLGEAA